MENPQNDPHQPDPGRPFDNPPGRDYNQSDPKRDPAIEEETRQNPEIQPVADGQETKSPLRPIDANRSPEEFRQAPLSDEQAGTNTAEPEGPTDGPVRE